MTKIKVPAYTAANGFVRSVKGYQTTSRNPSKNTQPEILFRKKLWALGLRYRTHSKEISGKPELIFLKKKVAVFVDGTFWHGFDWDNRKKTLKTNQSYWIAKIERNMQRDHEVNLLLEREGWRVIRIWEHDIKHDIEKCVHDLISLISNP